MILKCGTQTDEDLHVLVFGACLKLIVPGTIRFEAIRAVIRGGPVPQLVWWGEQEYSLSGKMRILMNEIC